MNGYKLTPQQAASLTNKAFDNNSIFNPVADINGDFFIFEGEVNGCTNEEFMWVKDLQPSEYAAPIETDNLN